MMAIMHTCATCAHDGQCVDLHYCGGARWVPDEDDSDADEGGYGPDQYDQWEHDSELWQEQADRRW